MKSKPDPRVRFEPDVVRDPRWLPQTALASPRLDPLHWMTRSARGFSWNRAGLAVSRDVHR
jgi:hypothetical protein